VDEFPRYVLEYLIDNYCSEETFHEDMTLGIATVDFGLVQMSRSLSCFLDSQPHG